MLDFRTMENRSRVAPRFAAFISYRHAPLDRLWAARVMDKLERFRTPPSLRKLGYPAKIGRLFRDDDEAGIGGSLTEQIQEALANSTFLILICSPRTRESLWVR